LNLTLIKFVAYDSYVFAFFLSQYIYRVNLMSEKCPSSTPSQNKSVQPVVPSAVPAPVPAPSQKTDLCGKDQGLIQPAGCPLEYINVTKTGDQIKVMAKGRASATPEDPRIFTGADRYADYETFWSFMKSNLKGFEQCKDPLDNDPDRFKSKSRPAPTQLSNQPLQEEHVMTIDEIMTEDDEMAYIEKDSSSYSYDFDGVIGLILRSLCLFALIYLMMTYIPQTSLETTTKILVAGTVVILYALLDFIGKLLQRVKAYACRQSCKGC
jgi:hypothetical protein